MADVTDRNQEATLFVGELDAQVTESLLWELFLQVGPVGEWQARVFALLCAGADTVWRRSQSTCTFRAIR